jgi:hypothetical protein
LGTGVWLKVFVFRFLRQPNDPITPKPVAIAVGWLAAEGLIDPQEA